MTVSTKVFHSYSCYDTLVHLKIMLTYLLTYLLTHSMVQSPSWEANWFSASQEIPRISRKPKVHYRTHKRPPPLSILGQPNPVHIPTSHLLEIHPNIIHPSTPRSPQSSPSLRFPHQHPIHPPLLTHTRHIPSPSLMLLFICFSVFMFWSHWPAGSRTLTLYYYTFCA